MGFEELVAYWLGELPQARCEEIEERVFADAALARQLEAVAQLQASVTATVLRGQVQHAAAADDLSELQSRGVRIREYSVAPGATVNCGVADEDFVAIRLRDVVSAAGEVSRLPVQRVDVEVSMEPQGAEPMAERYDDIPVDRGSGELIMLFPGDRIRPLPATRVRYRVFGEDAAGRRLLGEYQLSHSPSDPGAQG
ncbi:MAG: hypothetical protein PVI30_13805 [Myxococcales bacterium]